MLMGEGIRDKGEGRREKGEGRRENGEWRMENETRPSLHLGTMSSDSLCLDPLTLYRLRQSRGSRAAVALLGAIWRRHSPQSEVKQPPDYHRSRSRPLLFSFSLFSFLFSLHSLHSLSSLPCPTSHIHLIIIITSLFVSLSFFLLLLSPTVYPQPPGRPIAHLRQLLGHCHTFLSQASDFLVVVNV